MIRPDIAIALLCLCMAQALHADEKLDAAFEKLDTAFLMFLAEEAQDAPPTEQETELAVWLRDWWDPSANSTGKRTENSHENH